MESSKWNRYQQVKGRLQTVVYEIRRYSNSTSGLTILERAEKHSDMKRINFVSRLHFFLKKINLIKFNWNLNVSKQLQIDDVSEDH